MKYTLLSVNDFNAAERGKENNYYNRIFLLQRILHEMGLRIDLFNVICNTNDYILPVYAEISD
ncbi:MAG: hypothetical protein EGS40_03920 [Agathobacter sp.]|nr:hypothetical protein [Agathobacter sp.]